MYNKLGFLIFVIFISACQSNSTNNKIVQMDFQLKAATIESSSKLNIKTFSISSKEGAPKPNTDPSQWVPDSTRNLDLTTNKTLKMQYMGDAPFPHGRKTQSGDFSTKTCCGTSLLHWGARIAQISSPTNNQWGVYAGHKVNLTQTFSSADTLVYSPTTMPPNNTPIEVSTVYYRAPGSSSPSDTGRAFGVWDHTGIHGNPWIIYKSMTDTTWQNKYTANFTDGRFYFFQILKTSTSNNTWTVLLYNFQNGTWENQGNGSINFPLTFNYSTPPAQTTGWGFHEPKFDDICPNLDPIKLSSLQVWNGSSWYNNNSANGSSLINGGYWCSNWGARTMIDNHYNWTVNF